MKDYWHPRLMRPLTAEEIEVIRIHENLHRQARKIFKGRTGIGLPDHVADAVVTKVLQGKVK